MSEGTGVGDGLLESGVARRHARSRGNEFGDCAGRRGAWAGWASDTLNEKQQLGNIVVARDSSARQLGGRGRAGCGHQGRSARADGTAIRGTLPLRQGVVHPERRIRKRTIRRGWDVLLPTYIL